MLGNVSKFVWEKVRRANRLPGAVAAYKFATKILYPDGKLVTLRRGPAAGYRWRHYRCFQPWMAMGMYEPHVAKLIYEQLKPGDVFYDIGANAGYFTLVGAKAVGARGKVIAFDPNPFNVKTVREQVALNKLDSTCQVEPLAIAGEDGTFKFVVTDVNANAHLADLSAPHLNNEGQMIEVRAMRLDDYVATNPPPTLIKMDIEGAEAAAMNGARALLAGSNPPTCLISIHSAELDRQVKEIFREHGYTFKNLEGFGQMIYALPAGRS